MNLGFNSKLQLGDLLYHVQTEDRGLTHPFIDTVVLLQGQVLHRSSASYQDLLVAGTADQAALRARVERQHHDIMEGLRAGSLQMEKAAPATAATPALKILLRNSASWLVAGQVSLDIQVCARQDGRPFHGAEVEVSIEGAAPKPETFAALTEEDGSALICFPMPQLTDPEAAALVIRARLGDKQDQLRYHLKPKPRDSGSSR